jgi:hypothetical protein
MDPHGDVAMHQLVLALEAAQRNLSGSVAPHPLAIQPEQPTCLLQNFTRDLIQVQPSRLMLPLTPPLTSPRQLQEPER